MAVKNIIHLLEEVVLLLQLVNEAEWATSMQRLRRQVETTAGSGVDYQHALRDVLAIFGGMGSFSDLVLYRDGRPLQAENDRLAHLRHALFEAARADLR